MRNNNLSEIPTLEKYKEQISELITKLSNVPKIGLCSIPPIGENKDSLINNHAERFNDSIKAAANLNNIELLPVSDEIWSDISKRTYSLKKDYDSNAIPLMRRIFSGIYHHYLFKKSWNDIAKVKGQWILFDQIHLNERGAEIVFKLVKNFIDDHENIELKSLAYKGKELDLVEIKKLAALPTYDQAIAMLMSVMQAPIQKLMSTMVAVPTKVVRTLDAVKESKN